LEVVEFLLAGEKYAIDCCFVSEVAALGEYAPLPDAPAFILGVTSIRGRIVSIVDLGRFFDLPSVGLTDRNRVLVLSLEGMELGLLADSVDSVRRIFVDELAEALPTLTGARERLCRGILPEGRVLLHAQNLIAETALPSAML
jgi:purine-binding chemotaxis protein CheW